MAVVDVGPVLAMTEAIPLLDKDTDPGSDTFGEWVIGRNNAADIRSQLLTALFAPGSGELTVRNGWLPRNAPGGTFYSSGLVVQQATPAQSVQMYPGQCLISRAGQGVYLLTQATIETIPLDPADATNDRYDVIYVRMYDGGIGDAEANHGPQWCVIKGDPSATPTIPDLPAVDGVIPVVAILREAGVDAVTDAKITDLRRSAGWPGAVRPMLPGDALTDPGLIHGERRSRATPTGLTALGAPPILTDYWDAVGETWHGTESFVFDVDQVGTNIPIASGASAVVGSLTIPDPGWPYKISAGGSVRVIGFAAGEAATCILGHQVGSTVFPMATRNDDLCNWVPLPAANASGNGYWAAPVLASKNVYVGSKTLYQMVKCNTASGSRTYQGNDIGGALTVRVDPV